MKLYCLDAEWNGDKADVLHCVSVKEYPSGHEETFLNVKDFAKWVRETNVTKFFIHAGLTADVPVINSIAGYEVLDKNKVVDTFVVSRLVDYKRYSTHSLKEIGKDLGVYKGDYDGGWDVCTPEMVEYCEQDVEVLKAIVKKFWPYIMDPDWADAMRLEHQMATLCAEMQTNGFDFDKELATSLLDDVKYEMEVLESSFRKAFAKKLVEVKRLKMRYTKDGIPYASVLKAMEQYPKTEVEGGELVVYDYKEFNPGSPKDRIDVLWDAGWKPYEKTKGYINKEREERRKYWR